MAVSAENIGKRTKKERRTMLWRDIKKNKGCYGMIAPFMIFFIVFTIIPVVMSLPMGFTDFNMVQPPKFVGLSNFTTLFLSDKIFMKSIRVTLVFALFTGPVSYVLCFLLAWLINEMHPKLKTVFTLIFYAPSMANVYTVWQLIFSGDMNGYVNSFLINLGIINSPVQWLTDGRYVLGVTIVVQLWISLGAGFLALRAGFQNIDRSMYEAGAIEGIRTRWQELIYIVIPSMGPQLMFAAVMQIVSSFTAGTVAQNLVGFPSTDYKAHTIMTHAFDYGWQRFEMGYASAICMVLFVAMFACNKLINKVLGKYMD
ncbi:MULTISPECIES: carbohydrate ABC transporter permease [Ruminococcus]|uniref:Carbohydrate ABC transporter membrane protein 1, CUT1 family n=1 Tax=Ruminococcus flavefaciens TaxID=1265 RepID=A0A1M7KSR4_RUMFL|nr:MULTISPECIES: sugar ABC transporter permease [Ruminococcus]MCR4795582.1 sugar ABC transporter permease [Ruminococcus sp.]SHM68518.1 carbohydrate ABC transporter membrane protein 1, CUT1 family [Ruminococcus flavefaciens]